MSRTTREQFMTNVRAALGRRAPEPPPAPPVVDESLVRLAGPGDDLLSMFAQRAAQSGMTVRVVTEAGLPTQVLDVLREINACSATVTIERLPMKQLLEIGLQSAGIDLRHWKNDPTMATHYDVDVGITDVHTAIAETGTLVCCSDGGHGRGLSLVPPVHIAIVRRSDIVPDLLDYMRTMGRISAADLPSAQALITGPSKTGDIEGILVTGVHGPGRVFVLVVEDA